MENKKTQTLAIKLKLEDDKLAQLTQLIAEIGKKTDGMENWIRSIVQNELQSERFTAAVIAVVQAVYALEPKE